MQSSWTYLKGFRVHKCKEWEIKQSMRQNGEKIRATWRNYASIPRHESKGAQRATAWQKQLPRMVRLTWELPLTRLRRLRLFDFTVFLKLLPKKGPSKISIQVPKSGVLKHWKKGFFVLNLRTPTTRCSRPKCTFTCVPTLPPLGNDFIHQNVFVCSHL